MAKNKLPIQLLKSQADPSIAEKRDVLTTKLFDLAKKVYDADGEKPEKLDVLYRQVTATVNQLQSVDQELENSFFVRFNVQHKLMQKIHSMVSPNQLPEEVDRKTLIELFTQFIDTERSITKTTQGLNKVDIYKEAYTESPKGIYLPKQWFGEDVYSHNLCLMPGLPTVIGGFTGIGKTTLAINMAYYYYEVKKRQAFISLEMTGKDVTYKLLRIGVNRKNYTKIDRIWDTESLETFLKYKPDPGKPKSNHDHIHIREKYDELLKELSTGIDIYDNSGTTPATLESIRSELVYLHMVGNMPDIIYIDYAQIIHMSDPQMRLADRRNQIMQVIGELTQLAKVYKFALVLISQTNRSNASESSYETEDGSKFYHAPTVFSLSESASIEQNAGLVLTVGREWKEDGNDRLHISVEKNRFGKTHLSYMVKIDRYTQTLTELDSDNHIPEKLEKKPSRGKN